jgi:F0F1-type ATP synthase membrane subunit b/b'
MNFPTTIFLSGGGLFDFDLTFVAEALLFLLLSVVVTFVFISPVSKQLNERAELINYTLRKSTILLTLGYDKLSNCIDLLTKEINELNRQIKLVRNYTNSAFEAEVASVQKENVRILSKLKGDLSIKSAVLLASINKELTTLTDSFFTKRFKSVS